jgi:hypothetical protein
MLEEAVIWTALAISLISYALICYRDRSLINVATPTFFLWVPIRYLLELFYLSSNRPTFSTFAYVFVYGTYALCDITFALSYCCLRPSKRLCLSLASRSPYRILALILLIASWVLYAPVLWQFAGLLATPRQIYYLTQTRSGWGPVFFGSDFLLNLGFALLLLWPNRPRGLATVGFLSCIALALLHGTKGEILTPMWEALLFRVYYRGRRVGAAAFSAYMGSFLATVGLLFIITFDPGDMAGFAVLRNIPDFIGAIADYSDYNRNAMLVIDSNMKPTYGYLTFQNILYARVPRFLYPQKPIDYGSFYLDEEFYPQLLSVGGNVPDFSIGTQYLDFGSLSILYLIFWAALTGWLLRVFVDRFQVATSPDAFVMLLFFAGVPMITMGSSTYLLPEHLILAGLLDLGGRMRWGPG